MGFWYADTEDRTGPWHWNGVAISLCQTIGLHRNPDPSYSGQPKILSVINRRLWQQLWWSCFYREAWFSAGMGRPMRINLAECNTTTPGVEETDEESEDLPLNLREKYLPKDMSDLAILWTQLLKLTVILSDILLHQHRAEYVMPTENQVLYTESQIRACSAQCDKDSFYQPSIIVQLYKNHFDIYVEYVQRVPVPSQAFKELTFKPRSVSLLLYRPFLLSNSDSMQNFSMDWKSTIEQKTRSAAKTTNHILSSLISADMVNVCQSIMYVRHRK